MDVFDCFSVLFEAENRNGRYLVEAFNVRYKMSDFLSELKTLKTLMFIEFAKMNQNIMFYCFYNLNLVQKVKNRLQICLFLVRSC